MRRANIDGRMVEVFTLEEFQNGAVDAMAATSNMRPAVIIGDLVYPIKGKNDTGPGLYVRPVMSRAIDPTEDEVHLYSINNVIDFTNVESMEELIKKHDALYKSEHAVLTRVDKVFLPMPGPNDTPWMSGMKQAVCMKECDIDSYRDIIGPNFPNERRLFNGTDITINKLVLMCEYLGIKVSMSFEDAKPDVPNPMGGVVTVEVTSGQKSEEGER